MRTFIVLIALLITLLACASREADVDWSAYGGAFNDRYSDLTQIDRSNVQRLRVVWRFDMDQPGESQTHPLVIERTLYAYTPELQVIALDAASGRELWKFDSGLRGQLLGKSRFTGPARGLAYWRNGNEHRLLAGVMNYLCALDPDAGKPIASFGESGCIDLRKDLVGDYAQHYVSLTSPGVIFRDLIIVGFRTSESAPAPPGDIRAYDVRSGKLRWTFHTIPTSNEYGSDSWPDNAREETGAANNWAGMALDARRGIVYVPTGSAIPDFYGGERNGNNLFANTLLALDATTGQRLWHYQIVHHDIWDRDLPAPPSLLRLKRNGKAVDAIAQPTKQGFLFVFDRETGEPLFPIEERPVPSDGVDGERTSPTQPFPLAPAPFARQQLTEDMLTTRTPEAHAWAVQQFRNMRSRGQFVPLTIGQPTVVFPGFDGGAEWGGAAVDRRSGIIFINSNDIASTGALAESRQGGGPGASAYESQCSGCHGLDRKGSPPAFPSLVGIDLRMSAAQIESVIRNGAGRMPAFANISPVAMARLVEYVRTGVDSTGAVTNTVPNTSDSNARREMVPIYTEGKPVRYRFTGYNKFLDPDGYPGVQPPWGTLNAINLNTGEYVWKIPLGEYPELTEQGLTHTGSENYGGPIVTASGLLFIGATIQDRKFRAFDIRTGELLWESLLPFAGTATPITYMIDGKQYVVIGTSNAKNPKASQGSAYVAFALPD